MRHGGNGPESGPPEGVHGSEVVASLSETSDVDRFATNGFEL
jgi:hypothetical protein